MSEDYKIYVDADRPATLNNGAGVLRNVAGSRVGLAQAGA